MMMVGMCWASVNRLRSNNQGALSQALVLALEENKGYELSTNVTSDHCIVIGRMGQRREGIKLSLLPCCIWFHNTISHVYRVMG